MNYFEFTKRFPDEKSAIDFIVEIEQLSGKLCITLILNLPNSIGSKSKCQRQEYNCFKTTAKKIFFRSLYFGEIYTPVIQNKAKYALPTVGDNKTTPV